jgi:hypothetical protein
MKKLLAVLPILCFLTCMGLSAFSQSQSDFSKKVPPCHQKENKSSKVYCDCPILSSNFTKEAIHPFLISIQIILIPNSIQNTTLGFRFPILILESDIPIFYSNHFLNSIKLQI